MTVFDGTIAGLIKCYRTDERSPYHARKNKVLSDYYGGLNRIRDEIGAIPIPAGLNADRISAPIRQLG